MTVARMLGHSLAILMTTYAHLARFARYAHYVRDFPGTQDEAARPMDEILTPIPIDIKSLKLKDNYLFSDRDKWD